MEDFDVQMDAFAEDLEAATPGEKELLEKQYAEYQSAFVSFFGSPDRFEEAYLEHLETQDLPLAEKQRRIERVSHVVVAQHNRDARSLNTRSHGR